MCIRDRFCTVYYKTKECNKYYISLKALITIKIKIKGKISNFTEGVKSKRYCILKHFTLILFCMDLKKAQLVNKVLLKKRKSKLETF